ncbi:hypothetical protein FXO38_23491 [Capsicum annuum]|uniref:Glucose-6-phosphate dehydrogenase C-terminal domain-containing protein n=1 Tax=Capsicum annuum TaxID=4072 RepID=A0A2G2ZN11_CAPAN|nr:hypothetical protein FXO38_23491 [Capsicum annuum]PHT83363.1 hypothetical protein T459_11806 [Capsicum annuum]
MSASFYMEENGRTTLLDTSRIEASIRFHLPLFGTQSSSSDAQTDDFANLSIAFIGVIVEIRIQFHHVPGNLYHKDGGHVQDLSTNELILRDVPDEAILIRINKKLTGLSINLEASALNLLCKV